MYPLTCTDTPVPGSVLVLAPHPDDEVFGCGGALSLHVKQGDSIQVAIITDGAASNASRANEREYVKRRSDECRAASRVLGYSELYFMEFPDGELDFSDVLVMAIERLFSRLSFDTIYFPSIFEVHPDHLAVSLAALAASDRMGLSANLIMYEVGYPLFPNILLNVSTVYGAKSEAMHCFQSQRISHDYVRTIEALNVYRTYSLPLQVTQVEAFFSSSLASIQANPYSLLGTSPVRRLVGTPTPSVDLGHFLQLLANSKVANPASLISQL